MLDTSPPSLPAILDSLDAVIWSASWDPLTVHYVSPGAERLYGHSPAAFQADPQLWFDMVHPEDRARVEADDDLRARGASSKQYRIVRPDGGVRWVLDRAWIVRGQAGGQQRVDGIITDITAQLEADQALVEWTRRLEAVHTIASELTRERDLTTVLRLVIERALALTGGKRGTVWLWDEDRERLVPRAWLGLPGFDGRLRLRLGEGVVGQAAQLRQGVRVDDLCIWPGPAWQVAQIPQATAMLAEPILYQDRLVGAITNVFDDPMRSFSEPDQQVLRIFAAQAAVAIENARLYARQEQRLARQETLTRLNHLVSASLDLAVVLREIANAASTLMGAPVVSFWLADESRRCLEMRACSDPTLAAELPRSILRFDQGLVGWTATHRQAIRVPDVFADARTFALDIYRQRGLRSFLGLPIVHEGQVLAVLALVRRYPFNLQPDDEALLDSFSAQAAVAIRNARLFAAEAEARATAEAARQRYQALVEGIGAIVWESDVQGRCTYVNQAAEVLLGYPVGCWLDSAAFIDRIADAGDAPLLYRALYAARDSGLEDDLNFRARAADGRLLWLRALIWPVREGSGPPWPSRGLFIDITERRRALEEAARLRATIERLEERQRIAMDLHDGAVQTLYGAELQLTALLRGETSPTSRERLQQAREQIKHAIQDIRGNILETESEDLSTAGLLEGLGLLAEELQASARLRPTLVLDPAADSALAAGAAAHLLYLAREATSNVIRHAEASAVRIALERTDRGVALSVADNGRGFESGQAGPAPGHGLRNMAARAALVDGRLNIESAPGQGTTVRVELPARG